MMFICVCLCVYVVCMLCVCVYVCTCVMSMCSIGFPEGRALAPRLCPHWIRQSRKPSEFFSGLYMFSPYTEHGLCCESNTSKLTVASQATAEEDTRTLSPKRCEVGGGRLGFQFGFPVVTLKGSCYGDAASGPSDCASLWRRCGSTAGIFCSALPWLPSDCYRPTRLLSGFRT